MSAAPKVDRRRQLKYPPMGFTIEVAEIDPNDAEAVEANADRFLQLARDFRADGVAVLLSNASKRPA